MKLVNPKDFNENVFKLLDDKWALAASYDKDRKEGLPYNAMTVSWGGMGVLWNKNVFFCFVRPQRYTKEFIDKSDKITLSFFGDEMKKGLSYCGSHSGRDGDKLKQAGFSARVEEDAVFFDEAEITVVGKKLFCANMQETDFIDKELIGKCYQKADYHSVYICEIEKIVDSRS